MRWIITMLPNAARRGHLFRYRRKIALYGTTNPIAPPWSTVRLFHACNISGRLGAALEALRWEHRACGSLYATLCRHRANHSPDICWVQGDQRHLARGGSSGKKTSGRAPVCSSIRKWKPRCRRGGRNEAEAGSGRADHRHSEGGRGTAGDLWKNEIPRSTVSIYSRLLRMPYWLGDTCIRVDASPSFLKPAYADTALTTRLATAVSAHHG